MCINKLAMITTVKSKSMLGVSKNVHKLCHDL